MMQSIFVMADQHRGTSMIEILQNCVIFNDKCHSDVTGKDVKQDAQLHLEHGNPMIFGKENNKGIILNGLKLEVVTIGENGTTENDLLVHDAHTEDSTLHNMLTTMSLPEFPVAVGVIRQAKDMTYDDGVIAQLEYEKENAKFHSVDELLNSGDTWQVN
jgi:2-oxoglutarate ferredoxin oxidoreductase subunit beta